MQVRYADGREVAPGDVVRARVWLFWWREVVVDYVPGVSAVNARMAFGGLTWVSVRVGARRMHILVDPETGRLKRGVTLIRRGTIASDDVLGQDDPVDDGVTEARIDLATDPAAGPESAWRVVGCWVALIAFFLAALGIKALIDALR